MNLKNYITILVITLIAPRFYAQMFPIIKEGRWGSINLEGEIVIQPAYQYIGIFNNGYAVAAKNENFGVIDRSEKVMLPFRYEHVSNVSNNFFIIKKDKHYQLYDVDKNQIQSESFNQIEPISLNRFLVQKQSKWGVQQNFKNLIPSFHDTIILNANKLLFICDSSDKEVIYNQNGLRLFYGNQDNLYKEIFHKVVFSGALSERKFNGISLVQNNLFLFKDSAKIGLINAEEKRIVLKDQYDTIYNQGNWIVFKRSDSVGFCDINGTIIQELKPYQFYVNPNGIWTKANDVENQQITYTGFLFNNGNSIPAKFNEIDYNEDFYFTTKGRRKGLYTAKGKKILSCSYNEIIAEKTIIKAYKGAAMTKITLSASGNIISKQEFKNTVRITLNSYQKYKRSPSPFNNSNQSGYTFEYKYGWFGDTIRDTSGTLKRIKFGVQFNDSIYQRAVYNKIDYMEDYALTRASINSRRGKENGAHINFQPHDYFPFDQGKKINRYRLKYSNPTEWSGNKNIEVINTKGLFFMDSTGNLSQKMGYIDKEFDSLKRFLTFGKGPDKKCNYAYCLYSDRLPVSRLFFKNKTVAFKEGEWGFMDRSGKQLYTGKFDAVENFKNGTSIVSKGGKGLINKDSIVIPTNFTSLIRYKELGDTIFKAQKNEFHKFFTDSLLKPYNFFYHSIIKRIDDKLWIKKTAKSNGILDSNLKFREIKGIIKENYNNLLLVKKRGLYGIVDIDGSIIIPINYNKIIKLNEGFSILDKRSYGYANHGKIILETKFKSIEYADEKYIIAELNGLQGLYNQEGILLLKHNFKSIQINQITGEIIVVKKNGKPYLLSADLKKETQIKSDVQITGSIGSYFIFTERNKIGILDSNQNPIVPAQFEKIEAISPNIFQFSIGKKKKLYSLIDKTLTPKFYRETNWIFDDIYMVKQASHCQFYHTSGKKIHDAYYLQVEKNESGLALVRNAKGSFFMNRQFQNEFNEFFTNANSFYGNYACVGSTNGWQIINRKGFRKTYPSYGYLKPLFPNVFEAKTYALKGVLNSQGKELVPVAYEKINIISKKYIQAVNDGAIHYYDLFGNRIY